MPLPLLIAAIAVLWLVNSPQAYESAGLLIVLNTLLSTLTSVFIALLAGRSFLSDGRPGLLMLSCAMTIWGTSAFVAVVTRNVGNYSITIHNLGVCTSALCHLAGGILIRRSKTSLRAPGAWLALGTAGALICVGVIWLGTLEGWWPVFFTQGKGGTPVRDAVLLLSILSFGVTAALIWWSQRVSNSAFLRWYAMGLALLAIGGVGIMIQTVHGSALGWTARSAQYLAGVYMLIGAISAVRETRSWEMPLAVALQEAKGEYELLFQSINDGILLHEAGSGPDVLRLVRANDILCRMLRYTPDEIDALTIKDIFAPHALSPAGSDPALPGYAASHECTLLASDGERIEADVSMRVFEHRGRRLALSIIRDISERKRIEQERQQLLASERAARSEAERANRLKDDFLSIVSHELRSPLNGISMWTQYLQAGRPDPDELKEGLESIENCVRVQTRLVADLLDASRLTSGRLTLDVAPVNLAEVIRAASATIRSSAEAKGLPVELALDETLTIAGDAARIQQVAWNLLSNAVKFTPNGGRVRVGLARCGHDAEITVSDNGPGIAPEFLPHLFDRFRQAESSSTRRHGGLGLGLSLARQLVELHGGTIAAASAVDGQGSCFTVSLPLETAGAAADAHRRTDDGAWKEPSTRNAERLRGRRVLVVDDDVEGARLVSRFLHGFGVQTSTAHSVEEALSLLVHFAPHALLSDIGMPGRDGYDLIRTIRADNGLAALPAIALTAFVRSQDRDRALAAGYNAHIAKPIDMTELLTVLAALLDQAPPPDLLHPTPIGQSEILKT